MLVIAWLQRKMCCVVFGHILKVNKSDAIVSQVLSACS